MTMGSIRVDADIDFLCPWVYIGYLQFQSAISKHLEKHPDAKIEIIYHAYYLDPYAPPFGIQSDAYLDRIRGPGRSGNSFERVKEMEQRFDVKLNPNGKMGHTRRAHRLVRFARERHGLECQDRVVKGLFNLFWGDEGDITSREELARVGSAAGLGSEEEVLGFLEGEGFEDEVDRESERSRGTAEGGRMGVPRFSINQAKIIDGARGVDAFLSAFEEVGA